MRTEIKLIYRRVEWLLYRLLILSIKQVLMYTFTLCHGLKCLTIHCANTFSYVSSRDDGKTVGREHYHFPFRNICIQFSASSVPDGQECL